MGLSGLKRCVDVGFDVRLVGGEEVGYCPSVGCQDASSL